MKKVILTFSINYSVQAGGRHKKSSKKKKSKSSKKRKAKSLHTTFQSNFQGIPPTSVGNMYPANFSMMNHPLMGMHHPPYYAQPPYMDNRPFGMNNPFPVHLPQQMPNYIQQPPVQSLGQPGYSAVASLLQRNESSSSSSVTTVSSDSSDSSISSGNSSDTHSSSHDSSK